MRTRVVYLLVALMLAATAVLTLFAEGAEARRIPPVIGCDSLLNWPCPGPVL